MSWLNEYKKSLKNIHAEEPLDVYFYRPLAFVIVKGLYSLPITPNQYSLAALIAGMASGYNLIQGTSYGYKWGAIYFLIFAILDCCDGMVARLKKNGTKYGRMIDGFVDYAVNLIVYVTFAIGLTKQLGTDSFHPWVLIVAAGVSKIFHSVLYDHYLIEYITNEKGESDFVNHEVEDIKSRLSDLTMSGDPFFIRRIFLTAYLAYNKIQVKKNKSKQLIDPAKYCTANLRALKLWSFIGPAFHILIFVIACILNEPYLLFGYATILGNIWMGLMLINQYKIKKTLLAEAIQC